MLELLDPNQHKHKPQFSLFSGSPKPNYYFAELAKVIKKSLLMQGNKPEAAKSVEIAPFSAVHRK